MTGMVAPMVLASPEQWGPINGDRFEAYVRQVLVPELKSGDIVIMDNLSSHKRTAARELIEAAGAPALPPALQPRLQGSPEQSRRTPREGLLQGSPERSRRAQRHPAKGIGTDGLRALGPHRQARRYLQTRRMRQFLQLMWL